MKGFIPIAHTKKTYGIDGALKLDCPPPYDAVLPNLRAVFFDIDGGPVPYFVAAVTGGANPTIRFEDVPSPEAAKPLTGKAIYAAAEDLKPLLDPKKVKPLPGPEQFIGLHIHDQRLGDIGPIEEVLETPEQLLAVVRYRGAERLIPLHEALLLEFDPDTGVLAMDLPEGLLAL